ncbi:MAG: DUF2569 domain-containing protein [Archangium sp.]|nr:DUF2569 domain-containing protein [Archangium sp.]MDP3155645.1 DUF2569 domain-containing protein [Archangium sp.]MDP3570749.1 DUF2569 domain-containing protein [Archangium sp.]
MGSEDEVATETPYALAKRLHALGTASTEIERALRAQGLDEEEARIAARAGRGEAGLAPSAQREPLAAVNELPSAPPAEAPAHPCPTHPEWPVAATCSRCGKFICARCLTEAGFSKVPDSMQCPACEVRAPQLQGIGGWLVLPALHVSVMAPLSALVNLGQDAAALPKIPSELYPPVLMEMIFNGALLSFSIYVAIAFFQKKQRAVRLMITFYSALIISPLAGLALAGWIEGISGTEPGPSDGVVQVGRAFISSLLWISYFVQSKRVKATFVVP